MPFRTGLALFLFASPLIPFEGLSRQQPTAEQPYGDLFTDLGGGFAAPIREDERGSVWVCGGGGFTVFSNGDPRRARKVPWPAISGDPIEIYQNQFVSFLVTPEGEIWAGARNGTTRRFRNGIWETLSHPGAPFPQDVMDLALWGGRVYAAERGVFIWNERNRSWEPVREAGSGTKHFAEALRDELVTVGWRGVYRHRIGAEAEWLSLWSPRPSEGEPRNLAVDSDGKIFVGTSEGLVTLDRDGRQLSHELRGLQVDRIAPRSGERLWVATDKGLRYRESGRWHELGFREGLPSDDIRDLHLDRRGQLWTLSGRQLLVRGVEDLESTLRALPRPVPLAGDVFPDACEASRALLGDLRVSGQVSWDRLGAESVVFFSERQVCPDRWSRPIEGPNVYRRRDGTMVALTFNGARFSSDCNPRPCPPDQARTMAERWSTGIIENGRRTDLPLPAPPPSETPGAHFMLDSKNRVWVSTRGDGLFCFDGKKWIRYGAAQGLIPGVVSALAEDAKGNIWIGTMPDYDRKTGRYYTANLHRFDGKAWSHWSPNEGLGYWSLTAILPLSRDEIAAGTNGGLSLLGSFGIRTYAHDPLRGKVYVKSISEDSEGWLWLTHGSSQGLTWFDGTSFHNKTSREGLFADGLQATAHDGAGRVWILDNDGRVGVYSRSLLTRSLELQAPRVQ